MRTIIQVFGSLNAGGAESRMLDVYREIDRSQYKFIFLSLDTSEKQFYEKEILLLGGKVIKIASPREVGILNHLKQLIQLFKRLKENGRADAVHAHTSYHIGIVMLAARIAGIHIRIAHARTTSSLNRRGLNNKIMIVTGKTLIKLFATHKMALNQETALSLFGSAKDVQVIPNAIPLQLYKNAPKSEIYSDIPEGAPVLCHVGRFQPMKNHRFLIELFAKYIQRHSDAWLIMVGDGPLMAEMQDLTKQLKIDRQVIFTGLRHDIPNILAGASAFIFPSTFEGLGGSVLESQASGVGCVVSDTLPRNVDIGLGLVEFVGLEDSNEKWLDAIDRVALKRRPKFTTRYTVFNDHGFTLEHEIDKLSKVYENTYNYHNNI